MFIRYIALYMDFDSGYKDPFRDEFNLKSRFISNYLSIQVRKLKIDTDGTFNMLAITPSLYNVGFCRVVSEKALKARVIFNKEVHEQLNERERYEYYLNLVEDGYKICSQQKIIPLDKLLSLNKKFRENDYKNEWLHKKKRFKDHHIDVILYCFFTSDSFQLKMTVIDFRSKEELVSGIVVKTLPDEVCFQPLFKDVVVHDEYLAITEFQDRDKFRFLLADIYAKRFNFKIMDIGLNYIPKE